MNAPWNKPVVVMLGEPPQETAISSPQAAAWAMIEDWPAEDGTELDRALAILAAVDAGKKSAEDARRAVVSAAREAGILVSA